MGDRIAHYAAYKSMYRLLEWLIWKDANMETVYNHVIVWVRAQRRLTPLDVAVPETREWIYRKSAEYQSHKTSNLLKMQQLAKANQTPKSERLVQNLNQTSILKESFEQKAKSEQIIFQNQEKSLSDKNITNNLQANGINNKDESEKKNSLDFANIVFGSKS